MPVSVNQIGFTIKQAAFKIKKKVRTEKKNSKCNCENWNEKSLCSILCRNMFWVQPQQRQQSISVISYLYANNKICHFIVVCYVYFLIHTGKKSLSFVCIQQKNSSGTYIFQFYCHVVFFSPFPLFFLWFSYTNA